MLFNQSVEGLIKGLVECGAEFGESVRLLPEKYLLNDDPPILLLNYQQYATVMRILQKRKPNEPKAIEADSIECRDHIEVPIQALPED